MRRNGFLTCLSLIVLGTVAGCHKPEAVTYDPQAAGAYPDPYAPEPYLGPAREYDSYADEAGTTPEEAAYDKADFSIEPAVRYHTVAKKDTLFKLARTYYNDAAKWKDIYSANRSTISDPNKIYVGQQLVIP